MTVRVLREWGLYQPKRQDDLLVRNLPGPLNSHRVARAGVVLFYPLALLAIVAAVGLARRRRAELLILMVPIAITSLVAATSWGGTRLSHSAELVIVVLASVQLSAWWDRRRRRPT